MNILLSTEAIHSAYICTISNRIDDIDMDVIAYILVSLTLIQDNNNNSTFCKCLKENFTTREFLCQDQFKYEVAIIIEKMNIKS